VIFHPNGTLFLVHEDLNSKIEAESGLDCLICRIRSTAVGEMVCARAPLVLAPHKTMCMGVESFTEENRGLHVPWAYISIVDATVCKVTSAILHGVASSEMVMRVERNYNCNLKS